MKRRIISSLLAIILMISVVAVGASAAAAVDLSDYTASDSTVDFHIKEIYSKIDVAEYRALDEVVAYANALKSAAVNGTSVSDISISWNGSEYGLEDFCDEIVFPVIPMGSGARKAADAVMNDSSLWPLGTPVKDISQTVYDSASYTEVYNLWKHLRDDHKDGFLSVAEFIAEKAQLETKIKALKAPITLPVFKVASASLSLGESIAINFRISADVNAAYSNIYGIASCDGDVQRIEGVVETDGRVKFTYSNLTPKMAKVPVTFTLYGTANGTQYTKEVEYSVYKYCSSQYNKTTDANYKTLLTDFLNYATALQIYTAYRTDDLANAGFDQTYASATLAEPVNQLNAKFTVIENPAVKWNSVTLAIRDTVNVRLKFTAADINGLTVKFVINGVEIVKSEFTPIEGSANQYYVYFGDILPKEMRTPFTATVYKDGVAVSNTLQYSIQSYVVGKTTPGTNLNDLVIAMLKFGDACAAYFNK